MDHNHVRLLLKLLTLLFLSGARRTEEARVFTIVNYCKTTIWPGITPGEDFDGGGFALNPGESVVFTAPVGWNGRIWGRTGCNFDSDGTGSCQTGSCGNTIKCGASGQTPATLAEFNLASPDFYDVSLVDGFNLPMTVTPLNAQGGGNCVSVGCVGDLRNSCPAELAVKVDGQTVGCRSACDVFNTDQYCCRGAFGSDTCQPTNYSKPFKEECPTAYSYAYDDRTSLFTCTDADYIVSFCSQSIRKKTQSQRVCTYHINKLICSGSTRRASTAKWLFLILVFFVGLLWPSLKL
ncbi:pathogenesis-related thaumatin-like protein 3.5 [Curcuma longa]|uniref:pathogenesis-related thaumatin-like protein 3.5 n=1 Tax=Curcuma longa TaxID=136217 RepID=UPI003D9DB8CF